MNRAPRPTDRRGTLRPAASRQSHARRPPCAGVGALGAGGSVRAAIHSHEHALDDSAAVAADVDLDDVPDELVDAVVFDDEDDENRVLEELHRAGGGKAVRDYLLREFRHAFFEDARLERAIRRCVRPVRLMRVSARRTPRGRRLRPRQRRGPPREPDEPELERLGEVRP